MAVPANDYIDCVIKLLDDASNGCVGHVAFAGVNVKQGAGLHAAFVNQHSYGFDALRAQLRNQRIHGGHLVFKFKPSHTRWGDDAGCSLQRHADKSHLHAVKGLGAIGR